MSIKKVRIQNYKGLEDLEFEPSRINIFVGRNNTGKSSALEAVALTLSATNGFKDASDEDLLSRVINRRLPERWPEELDMLKYFIRLETKEGHVYADVNGKSLRLDLQFFEEDIPESDAGDKFIKFLEDYSSKKALMDMQRRLPGYPERGEEEVEEEGVFRVLYEDQKMKIKDKILQYPKLFITGRLDSNIISESVCIIRPTLRLRPILRVRHVVKAGGNELERLDVFFEHKDKNSPLFKMIGLNEIEEVKKALGGLVRKNKHEGAIGLIRKEVEYFKDVREVGGELLCSLTTGTVPLSFMGDGFLALLDITFMSVLAEGGAVFIEEPETCLHPGFLDVVARQIVNSAEYIQFFISTHNAELLEYLLEAGKDHLKLFRFVRLYQMPDGELGYEVFTGEEAAEEIFEIKTDLRGI
jgi:hypothetical protein